MCQEDSNFGSGMGQGWGKQLDIYMYVDIAVWFHKAHKILNKAYCHKVRQNNMKHSGADKSIARQGMEKI
jgi:hypothetical protein